MEHDNIDSINILLENYDKQKSIDTASDWKKLHKQIKLDRNKKLFLHFVKTVAALLLPLFLLWQYVVTPTIDQQKLITVESSPYGVSKVVLTDGSEVWLNSSSTLTYPAQFNKKERTVELNGEAYFKVEADRLKRFNVLINKEMKVSAYGTEFNINAYKNTNSYSVILTTGNLDISLFSTQNNQKLLPGQEAIVTPDENEITILTADVYLQTAWKDGKMMFYRDKFADIADRLSKRFDVIFEFADETIKEQQYTATFTTESITEILDLLKQTAPIDYTISYAPQSSNSLVQKRINLELLTLLGQKVKHKKLTFVKV